MLITLLLQQITPMLELLLSNQVLNIDRLCVHKIAANQ